MLETAAGSSVQDRSSNGTISDSFEALGLDKWRLISPQSCLLCDKKRSPLGKSKSEGVSNGEGGDNGGESGELEAIETRFLNSPCWICGSCRSTISLQPPPFDFSHRSTSNQHQRHQSTDDQNPRGSVSSSEIESVWSDGRFGGGLGNVLRHSSHPRDLLDLSCSIQSSEHNEDEDDDEYQNFDFDNDRDVEPERDPLPLSSLSATDPGSEEVTACDCASCGRLRDLENASRLSADELNNVWAEVRDSVYKIYRQNSPVMSNGHNTTGTSNITTSIRETQSSDTASGSSSSAKTNSGSVHNHFRLRELANKLSGSDAHLFFRRLEAQATEYVIEVKATLLHNLTSASSNSNSAPGGSAKTPSFCVDFVQLLLNLFSCLSQSAQHISEFIRHLEQEHLSLFKMTWGMHNRNLFRTLCWEEPLIRGSMKTLLAGLTEGCSGCPVYPREKYISIYKEYVEFTEEMTVMGVVWGETERLLDLFRESQTRNEVRARNLSQEIDTFHRDRFLWHQQMSRFSQSKAFMSLYTSILAEEADHHERALAELRNPQPSVSHTGDSEELRNGQESAFSGSSMQNIVDSSIPQTSGTGSIIASGGPRDGRITDENNEDDEEEIGNVMMANQSLRPRITACIEAIRPPSVPSSSDSEDEGNQNVNGRDADSSPLRIIDRPRNISLGTSADFPEEFDSYDSNSDLVLEQQTDKTASKTGSIWTDLLNDVRNESKRRVECCGVGQKSCADEDDIYDDDDDSEYHHDDQRDIQERLQKSLCRKLTPPLPPPSNVTAQQHDLSAGTSVSISETGEIKWSHNLQPESSMSMEQRRNCVDNILHTLKQKQKMKHKAEQAEYRAKRQALLLAEEGGSSMAGKCTSGKQSSSSECRKRDRDKDLNQLLEACLGSTVASAIQKDIQSSRTGEETELDKVDLDEEDDNNDPCECPVCKARGLPADDLFSDHEDDEVEQGGKRDELGGGFLRVGGRTGGSDDEDPILMSNNPFLLDPDPDIDVFGARKLVFPPFIPPPPPNTIRFRPPLPTSLPPIGLDGDDDFDDDFDDLSPYTYTTSMEAKSKESGKSKDGKEEEKKRDFIDMDEDPSWRRKLDSSIEDINNILDSLCPPPPPLPSHLPPCDSPPPPPPPTEPAPDACSSASTKEKSSIEHKSTVKNDEKYQNSSSKSDDTISKESESCSKDQKQVGKSLSSSNVGDNDIEKVDENEEVAASLSWDQEVLKKSLKEYLEQVQAKKLEMEKKIKQKFASREAAKKEEGSTTDPGSSSAIPSETKTNATDTKSSSPSRSGDSTNRDVCSSSKSDSKSAVSFRMPIGDVDYTSEVSECDSLNTSFSSAKNGGIAPGTKETRIVTSKNLKEKTVTDGKAADLPSTKKLSSKESDKKKPNESEKSGGKLPTVPKTSADHSDEVVSIAQKLLHKLNTADAQLQQTSQQSQQIKITHSAPTVASKKLQSSGGKGTPLSHTVVSQPEGGGPPIIVRATSYDDKPPPKFNVSVKVTNSPNNANPKKQTTLQSNNVNSSAAKATGTGSNVKSTNVKTTPNGKTLPTAASPGKSSSSSGVSNILKKGFLNNWSTKKQPSSPQQQQQPVSSSTIESVTKEKSSSSKQDEKSNVRSNRTAPDGAEQTLAHIDLNERGGGSSTVEHRSETFTTGSKSISLTYIKTTKQSTAVSEGQSVTVSGSTSVTTSTTVSEVKVCHEGSISGNSKSTSATTISHNNSSTQTSVSTINNIPNTDQPLKHHSQGHPGGVLSNGCKNTDKCHCFLGAAASGHSMSCSLGRSREDGIREKLRKKLDGKKANSGTGIVVESARGSSQNSPDGSVISTASSSIKDYPDSTQQKSSFGTGVSGSAQGNVDRGVKKKVSNSNANSAGSKNGQTSVKHQMKDHFKETSAESATRKLEKHRLSQAKGDSPMNTSNASNNTKSSQPGVSGKTSTPDPPMDVNDMSVDTLAAYIEGIEPEKEKSGTNKKSKNSKRKKNKDPVEGTRPLASSPVGNKASTSTSSSSTAKKHAKDVSSQPIVEASTTDKGVASSGDHRGKEAPSASKRQKNNSIGASLDAEEIFKPRDDLEGLDEGEKELEMFKRVCMDTKPLSEKPRKKICLNLKDMNMGQN